MDSLHQVSNKSSDLVSHSLAGNDGDIGSHTLVGVEIQSQARVILLDDNASGLLNGLCSDTLETT